MDGFARRGCRGGVVGLDESAIGIGGWLGEEDARLLERLAERGEPVRFRVRVELWRGGRGERRLVEGGDVAAGEDVRGGEGGGGLDAVEEEDLVGGGEEDDACAGAGWEWGFGLVGLGGHPGGGGGEDVYVFGVWRHCEWFGSCFGASL